MYRLVELGKARHHLDDRVPTGLTEADLELLVGTPEACQFDIRYAAVDGRAEPFGHAARNGFPGFAQQRFDRAADDGLHRIGPLRKLSPAALILKAADGD